MAKKLFTHHQLTIKYIYEKLVVDVEKRHFFQPLSLVGKISEILSPHLPGQHFIVLLI